MNTSASLATQEELLSLEEAADVLSVSKSTLYRMLERKEVKGRKVGRQWRFSRADLQAYLDRGPQAVVISAVQPQEIDALLPSLAEPSHRAGVPLPTAESLATPAEKVAIFTGHIIKMAITVSASDIHLAPEGESALIRFRIDGVLQEFGRFPAAAYPAVIGRVKEMAALDTEECRLPQDGRIRCTAKDDGREYDIRVNVLPTVFGESAVLRILDQSSVLIGLARLGFTPEDQERLERWLRIPAGLILLTGPTGSGKTTTAYSCLTLAANSECNTLTIEDPVEYLLPYTRQTMVNRRAGLTFASALRAFLRQDPDIIFVGEVRDLETMEIAIQAALTGHLVLTTLHPNDSVSAMLRMIDMGVAPFMIGSAVHGILAQRLVRKVCPHCRQSATLTDEMQAHVRELALHGGYAVPMETRFYQAMGCEQCYQRGYRGRTALFSLLEMTPAVRDALLRRAPLDELSQVAVEEGMHTLFADGIRKAVEGTTTLEEVFRVAMM